MTEMKLYMQRCEEMRKQAMAERHAEATDEFGFCSGTTYKEWKTKTGMKGVSRKSVYASSLEQAHQKANGLNLSVVRELNENEYEGL
jgi:hypothetical protein